MGFLDDAKDKAAGLLGDNKDKVGEGVDKVAGIADEKTGGTFTDQIDQGADQAKDALGNLDG
ncbi:antitoxin [Nocardioides terrisoli]|uniref:antitoxin n=1 Tax=Nocardioides terrisoli TaxID=3388267 RepID=UPI00287B8244|nr:antitoxin [Nocardioides marmorisolisilvae]